ARPLVPLPTARIQLDLEDLDPVLRRVELFVLELAHRVRLLHDEGDQPLAAEADRGQQSGDRADDAGPVHPVDLAHGPDRLCFGTVSPPYRRASKSSIRATPR